VAEGAQRRGVFVREMRVLSAIAGAFPCALSHARGMSAMNGEGSARLAETQAQEIVTRRLAHDAATAASICAAAASGVISRP